MSIHFHLLKIKEVRRETPACVSVFFEIPSELKKSFSFQQGQSLTIRFFLNREELRRTYSICSSPLDSELQIAIKKQESGLFSSFAIEKLKAGDELEVMEPVGKFYTELDPSHKKNYLAFAAGSGISPVISIIKTTLRTEPHSHFTLVYGNQSRSSIIFFEELEGMKNIFLDRFNLIHILSREKTEIPLNSGRISLEKLNELGKLIDYFSIDDFFICGPEEMIFCAKDFLEQKGIDPNNIHFELFTTAGKKRKATNSEPQMASRVASSTITVKLDGRAFDFSLSLDGTTILDGALKQGADLPYACKGGMCCTCKAKLLEGEVEMDVHWGLEEEEIKKGYILTCQSHPKTEKVVVDFDIK